MRYRHSSKLGTSICSVTCLVLVVGSAFVARPAWSQVSYTTSASTTFKPHTPLAVHSGAAAPMGHYEANQMIRLTLGLQPPHLAEERQFLENLQSQGKTGNRQYLSAKEWTARFDPSVEDEKAVLDWAQGQGFTVVQRYPNRLVVEVEAPASTIERALNVTINRYQLGSETYFSNDRDPQIPSSLVNILHSIGGLNNMERLHPASKNMKEPPFVNYAPGAVSRGPSMHDNGDRTKLPQLQTQTQSNGVSPNYTSGAPYDPQDMYSVAAYSVYALTNLGHCCNPTGNAGGSPPETSIAIASFGTQQASDIAGFHAQYPYLAYDISWIYPSGTPSCCDGEGTMDMEWSTAMANSFGSYLDTAHVYMYDGVSYSFSNAVAVYNRMLTDGLARNFSTSWGCEEVISASQGCYDEPDADTADAVFASMTGQGWSLTAATGDQGASAGCDFFGTPATAVQFPGSDPFIVGAGGTTHYMFTEGGNTAPSFAGFTAWTGGPDGCDTNDGGSTGGYSTFFSTPSYQSSLGIGSRGVPDIALNADWFNTPQNLYFESSLSGNGGTSIVAPETVGFFAQENAYLLSLGNICGSGSSSCAPLGAVNPLLYEEGIDKFAPHSPFYFVSGCNNNDITSAYGLGYYCMPGSPGWGPVTGWGEYNFLQLAWAINWLHVPGFSEPVVNFSGPTTNTWYNSDAEVSWTVSAPAANSYPSPGTSGFTQNWDSDPGNPTSEVSPGIPESTCVGYPCVPYNAYYNGPQYANGTSGCLDLTGALCAGSVGGVQGWHTVNVRAWGNEGENGGDYTYGPIGYDTIAPVTTASLSGTLISGTTYKSAVKVTLSASDPGAPTTGSGVAATYYALNSGAYHAYTGPFTVGYTGSYTVHFYSVDKAGNTATASSVSFSINPVLNLSPTSLAFATEVLGTTSAGKVVTITNITTSAVSISSIIPSGDFAISSKTCGSSLAGSGNCTVTVTYKPSVVGGVSGDLTIAYTGIGSPDRLGLSGTGLAPLTATPASLAFGTVTVGTTSAAKTVTLKNDNPSTALSISFASSGDYTVTAGGGTPCGTSLAASASCTLSVTFKPHQNGGVEGAVTVTDGVSLSPLVVALNGSGSGAPASPLTFSPTSLSYTNTVVGTSVAKTVTVKNVSASSVSITKVSASGDYSASGCVTTLAPLATCTLTVTFKPSTTGTIDGSVALSNGTTVNPDVLNIVGTAILPLTISPATVNFGNVTVGTSSASTTITLSNNTAAAISIGFTASGDFSATAGGGTPCTASLGAGAHCTLVVKFSPTTTGAVSGVVTVTYAGGFSPQAVKLTGTGQ